VRRIQGLGHIVVASRLQLFILEVAVCVILKYMKYIAQFTITINSNNVCPHIRVLNTLMRESYA